MMPPVGSIRITDRMQTRSSRQHSRCRKANESFVDTSDNATDGKTLIYTFCGSTDRIASERRQQRSQQSTSMAGIQRIESTSNSETSIQ